MISIRKYEAADRDALWAILEPVILAGETYDFPRDTGKEAALADWLDADNRCYVAEDQGHILGTYVLQGFQIVGRIPDAFLHPALGYTDALVMHQKLAAIPAPPSADVSA